MNAKAACVFNIYARVCKLYFKYVISQLSLSIRARKSSAAS